MKPTMQAVKWLGMDRHGKMAVAPAAEQVLKPLPETQPINLISIFGAARQGKSFLMNLLANQQDLFRISNEKEPCTQGVDLSSHFMPLTEFSRQNGNPSVSSSMKVGFVDAEGQGDRDITYDSRLVSPVLLTSKVVIFNWKDSLQADRMLNLLAVLAKAAQNVELADGDNRKVFGHLHIVFRDWNFVNTTPEQVYDTLFKKEKGGDKEVGNRNLARHELVDAFESIQVWLFPSPVVSTAQLSERIRFDQLQPSFQTQMRDLRKTLSNQLKTPMQFNNHTLTGPVLSEMIPFVAEILNDNRVIMPESIYASMRRAEAKKKQRECEDEMQRMCDALLQSETLVSTTDFSSQATDALMGLLGSTMQSLQKYPEDVVEECKKGLHLFLERQVDASAKANNELVLVHFQTLMDNASDNLSARFNELEDQLPLAPADLSTICDQTLAKVTAPLLECPTSTATTYHGEIRRLQQQATAFKERLQHLNERAIRTRTTELQAKLSKATLELKAKGVAWLDKRIQAKAPFTIAMLEAQLTQWLETIDVPPRNDALDDLDVRQELRVFFTQLLEDLKRQYTLHVRHVLHQFHVDAKAALEREIHRSLGDKTLPMEDAQLVSVIHKAKDRVVTEAAEAMQGWSFPQEDMEHFGALMMENMEQFLGQFGAQNRIVTQDTASRHAASVYQETKDELISLVHDGLVKQMPLSDSSIDTYFKEAVTQAAEYMLTQAPTSDKSALDWETKFHVDLTTVKAQLRTINQKEVEKKEWMEAAEAERIRLQELENQVQHTEALAQEREKQIKSILIEKEQTSAHLTEELSLQTTKTQALEQQLEALRVTAEEMAKEKARLAEQATSIAAKERADKEKAVAEQSRRQAALQKELDAMQAQLAQQQAILQQKEEEARLAAAAKAKAEALEREKEKAYALAETERALREKMLAEAKSSQASAAALQNKMSSALEKKMRESEQLQTTLALEKAKADRLEAELKRVRAEAVSHEREKEKFRQQALNMEVSTSKLREHAQEESRRRAEAEAAAAQAAKAAAAAAKAAMEAAAASPARAGKRKSDGDESGRKAKTLKVKAPLPKMSLAEAKRLAKEDMDKRIASRASALEKGKKAKAKP
ncbi:hypothetical protein SDRG_06477 [Saprolegnia diclina VS20]|uniref:Guanylate-binding protein N-terminal domain-containing protein n=1 Tax=Saprolegnia diclina (strain VS20) TaxID=1156394 RepID=T0RV41_SAPDV|nr:hypothetical protein SDRG_06477 [Saprolegnia diclina VS20]EQC36373.1 hypothetical protein SDRG_06477 [Saprolegnia diclina VS20]|eukprot:XP_008610479.1 hypothetical protein SDRG_06477 [Saprolegnia diclina VS20]